MSCFLSIEVGEAVVRAGVVDIHGSIRSTATATIWVWRGVAGRVEQSGEDIWSACCRCARSAIEQAGIETSEIAGVGFCAVNSLVVLDRSGNGVPIGDSDVDGLNVIAASDSRALNEAQEVQLSLHEVLRNCGGSIDASMQVPRLLWLKGNLPGSWKRGAEFFDLADFLTYRATGDAIRSLSVLTSRWNFDGRRGQTAAGWVSNFFQQLGLGDLVREEYRRIGRTIGIPGQAVGGGASLSAARELGIPPGTPVSVGISREQAQNLGLVGARPPGHRSEHAPVAGRILLSNELTLNCLTPRDGTRFVRRDRSLHCSMVVPDLWLLALGLPGRRNFAAAEGAPCAQTPFNYEDWSTDRPTERSPDGSAGALWDREGLPSVDPVSSTTSHPTGSPAADSLERLFLHEFGNIRRDVDHEIRRLNRAGLAIDTLVVDGGIRNRVLLQELSSTSGCGVVSSAEPDTAILGSAMLAAVASGHHPSIASAIGVMGPSATALGSTVGGRVERVFTKISRGRRMGEGRCRLPERV